LKILTNNISFSFDIVKHHGHIKQPDAAESPPIRRRSVDSSIDPSLMHAEIIAQTRRAKLEKWQPHRLLNQTSDCVTTPPLEKPGIDWSSQKNIQPIVWVDWLEEYQENKRKATEKAKERAKENVNEITKK